MGYVRNDRRYGYGREDDRPDYERSGDPRDRGFFDRAGDEVRSWFGDEEAERRRRMDEYYDERYERGGGYAPRSTGSYGGPDRYPAWDRSNTPHDSRRNSRASGYTPASYRYSAASERQFGTSYPDLPPEYSSADLGYGRDDGWRNEEYRRRYRAAGAYGQHDDDDHHGYRSWRDQQIGLFDRDYDEYRRENRDRFASEFSTWRQNRQTQRDSLRGVTEHMEVIGSDGAHVGTVDHVRGDRILLTKTDRDAGGHHHSIPSSWIQSVDDKVHLAKTAEQAQQAWRDEETNRGLLGGHANGGESHAAGTEGLGRSYSGTY